MTYDTWHVTCEPWHVWGGVNILSKFQLLPFVIYDIMKIWRKRMNELMNELINYETVYRTALATPGLLNSGTSRSGVISSL